MPLMSLRGTWERYALGVMPAEHSRRPHAQISLNIPSLVNCRAAPSVEVFGTASGAGNMTGAEPLGSEVICQGVLLLIEKNFRTTKSYKCWKFTI